MLILPTVSTLIAPVWRKYVIARHSPSPEAPGGARPAIGSNRSSGSQPAIGGRRSSGGHPVVGGAGSSGAFPPVGTVKGINDTIEVGDGSGGAPGGRVSGSTSIYSAAGASGGGAIREPGEELPAVPAALKAPAHYDLFFEMEAGDDDFKGLLHFSTVTDQPPIGDGEVLTMGAMHRRRYLHFEGPIGRDRGSVRIIDRGSFRWMPQSDPAAGQYWVFMDGGLLSGIFSICVIGVQPVESGSEFQFRFQYSEFPA